MASEIRVNNFENLSGLGTVRVTDTGPVITGVCTADTFDGGSGSFTILNAGTNTALHVDGGAPALSLHVQNDGVVSAATTISASKVTAGIVTATEITGVSTIGVTTVTATTLTVNGNNYPSAGPLSNRNLIINGAMQVAQRGTEETGVTGTGYHTCDRMRLRLGALGTWTIQQSTDAPNGFSNSYRILCTTADASPAASDSLAIDYRIEAQDLQHLFDTGTTTYPLTLSFWVKSSNTGDASIDLLQDDNSSRHFSASYNIAAIDTWQFVTIPIPADTAAAFNNDNGIGLQVMWWLNSGSNFTGGSHQAGWNALTQTNRNATNLGLGGAINDDFFITGIQLEVGEVATPFEHRSFGDELARCQRYYYQIDGDVAGSRFANGFNSTSTLADFHFDFPTKMRDSVTAITQSGTAGDYSVAEGAGLSVCNAVPVFINGNKHSCDFRFQVASGMVGGQGCIARAVNTNAFIGFSAEL